MSNCNNILLSIFTYILIISCNNNAAEVFLEKENLNNFYTVNELQNFHLGECIIDSSFVIAHCFDKKTRKNPQLALINLKKKKFIGFFKWPSHDDSFYFSLAYSNNELLSFNGSFFVKTNIFSKRSDTLFLKEKIRPFNFISFNKKIYSIGNIYGINIMEFSVGNKTIVSRQIQSYYNEQNNISLPVSKDINLISSISDKNEFTLFAYDNDLNKKWSYKINLKNPNLKIQTIAFKESFLIKYDNNLELISKSDGIKILSKKFSGNIIDVYKIDDDNVVISKAGIKSNSVNINNEIDFIIVDPITLKMKNQILVKNVNTYYFDDFKRMYVQNSSQSRVIDIEKKKEKIIQNINKEIIRDRLTGKNYMKIDNTFVW